MVGGVVVIQNVNTFIVIFTKSEFVGFWARRE